MFANTHIVLSLKMYSGYGQQLLWFGCFFVALFPFIVIAKTGNGLLSVARSQLCNFSAIHCQTRRTTEINIAAYVFTTRVLNVFNVQVLSGNDESLLSQSFDTHLPAIKFLCCEKASNID